MEPFNLEQSIRNWLKQFRKHQAFNHGSIREMELHLRDHIDDLVAAGHTEQQAFDIAVQSFGEIRPMAREEFWNLRPKSSSTLFNTAMLKNYVKIAVRNFLNHKFYSFANVTGLTLGLSIVFLIGLFIIDELSFDKFHAKKDQLYRVVENQFYSGQPVFPVAVTPTALGPSLLENFPDVVRFTRVSSENNLFVVGENKIMERDGIDVDEHFFEMFSFPVLYGSVESFKKELNGLILNEELAQKYFPDKNPIGEQIKLGEEEFVVTAVIKNVPANSHLFFRYIRNYENFLAKNPTHAENWGSNRLYTYVELAPGADVNGLNEKIKNHIKEHNEGSVTEIYLQPLTNIYLGAVSFTVEVDRKGEMMYVKVFGVVAIFILAISCINFMNLSTARSAKRAKEVGLRKTVGAYRRQLIFQFLSESVFLSLLAVVLAVVLVVIALPFFNQLSGKQFELQMFLEPGIGVRLVVGLVAIALLTGLLAGSYPAIFLSSAKPILSLNAQMTKGKRGSGLRKVLVVTQFAISVVLIIGTLVVYNQLQFIQDADLGYNRNNIMYTHLPSDKAETFTNELRQMPGIKNVGLTNRHPAYVLSSTTGIEWPGKNPDDAILIHFMGIDEHYAQTMEIEILEGRYFEHTDSTVVLINEKAKAVMGLDDPVGVTINANGERKIVGVVKDFNFKSIHTAIEPIIIFKVKGLNRAYIRYEPESGGDIVSTVQSVWTKLLPDREFTFFFLDQDFEKLYDAEKRTSTLSTFFATLAILISCLGLFGLVSYATEQRTKEVGIRKVMGASVHSLFFMLAGDFTRLVLLSLPISIPIGWYAMNKWLQGFAYRIDLSVWIFVIAAVSALAIAWLTVSYQTIKASLGNPVNALRNE